MGKTLRMFNRLPRSRRFLGLSSLVFMLAVSSVIPLRLAIAHHQAPLPQAIFVLGGGKEREQFTAQFAQHHRNLPIWISSGIVPTQTRNIFQAAKIPPTHLHIDCQAIDTVTNFTTLVTQFKQQNIHHLYLVTADFHMPRATAIATVVLGSQGIAFTPIAAPIPPPSSDHHSPESWTKTLRDSSRGILWLVTGQSGASFNPRRVMPCT